MSVQALPAEKSLSLIHSLPNFPATLATPQSAAVIAVRAIPFGIARASRIWHEVRVRSHPHHIFYQIVSTSDSKILRSRLMRGKPRYKAVAAIMRSGKSGICDSEALLRSADRSTLIKD